MIEFHDTPFGGVMLLKLNHMMATGDRRQATGSEARLRVVSY